MLGWRGKSAVLRCGNLAQVDLSAFDEDRSGSYPETDMCALLHDAPPKFARPEPHPRPFRPPARDNSRKSRRLSGVLFGLNGLLVLIPKCVFVR